MKPELSFLLEIFMEPKLPKGLRDKIIDRIKEIEQALTANVHISAHNTSRPPSSVVHNPTGVPQAASTIALMARHGDTPPAPVQAMAPPIIIQELSPAEAAARNASRDILKRRLQPLETRK